MRDEDLWPVVQVTGGAPAHHVEMAIEECEFRAKTYHELAERMRGDLRRRESERNRIADRFPGEHLRDVYCVACMSVHAPPVAVAANDPCPIDREGS